ncbi:hypothetical protein BC939DRAFT_316020 [Gamsiella multidivaricata]|uniref:uncharacterized protein n=1 Tax=Gamsiella multidivaricata TaxID=101098 RepID=UPI0022202EA5|nr:uncharacterized protein BC939DRAFT_316020 [Gamsiella multidivaricata]KAI7817761.1 hypothetical protein BC939DRAFT_316020 [Gamsiella multidivaricata]
MQLHPSIPSFAPSLLLSATVMLMFSISKMLSYLVLSLLLSLSLPLSLAFRISNSYLKGKEGRREEGRGHWLSSVLVSFLLCCVICITAIYCLNRFLSQQQGILICSSKALLSSPIPFPLSLSLSRSHSLSLSPSLSFSFSQSLPHLHSLPLPSLPSASPLPLR